MLLYPGGPSEMSAGLLESIPSVVFRCVDPQDELSNFLYISSYSSSLLGLAPEALLERPSSFWQALHAEDRRELLARFRIPSPLALTLRYHRGDQLLWLSCRATPTRQPSGSLHWDGVLNDVTAFQDAERKLTQAQSLLTAAQQNLQLGCWDFDLASGKISWTREVFLIHGVDPSRGEPTFEQFRALYHAEDFPILAASIEQAIQHATPYQHDLRIIRPGSGEVRYVLATGGAMLHPLSNTPTHLFGTLLDITERKNLELTLARARDAAQSAHQAKADFLASMSHEFRTPLNGIVGMANLLNSTTLDPRQIEYCDTIRNSGEVLLSLVNDILDFSRIESGSLPLELAPTSIYQLLLATLDILRPLAAQKQLDLVYTVSEGEIPLLLADASRLRQVLLNLARNAIKFTSSGSVGLHLYRLALSSTHCSLRIEVTDTGIGIAPEALPHLFDHFYQADTSSTRQFGGTGMGLAISHRLAQLMGGTISVQSTLAQGSSFSLELQFPLAPALASSPTAPSTPLHILVAEDNRTNQRLAAIVLEKAGHHVHIVDNGRAALHLAQQGRFDLILMDCHMPEMDGFTASRAIRTSLARQVPIIALTASAMAADRDQCSAAGMDDYLAKPYIPAQLLDIVHRWAPQGLASRPNTEGQFHTSTGAGNSSFRVPTP